MFERFTQEARRVVIAAQDEARRGNDREIRPVHLLTGLVGGDGPVAESFHSRGVDADAVRREVCSRGERVSEAGADAAALAALGIDLEQVRARVEATFGAGALERHPQATRAWWRRRPGRSGPRRSGPRRSQPRRSQPGAAPHAARRSPRHIPFAPGAKKSLELGLREAIRLRDRQITAVHLALALLRADDHEVDGVLFTLGVDAADLRAALERSGRRAA